MSAIGRVGATCSQNAKTLDEYYDCLDQGRLPVVRGLALDGALTMALFALGSSVSLLIGPWLLLRLRGNGRRVGHPAGGSGPGADFRLGLVDGPGAQHGTLVHHALIYGFNARWLPFTA